MDHSKIGYLRMFGKSYFSLVLIRWTLKLFTTFRSFIIKKNVLVSHLCGSIVWLHFVWNQQAQLFFHAKIEQWLKSER